jgi:DNA-binding transcriptional ArsR family regulator
MISTWRTDERPLSLRHAADVLQALGHPIRLQILETLRRGPATVGIIVEQLALDQPVVSRHLAILRRAGVVTAAPDGRERIYRTTGDADALLGVLFTRKRGSA